MECLRKWHRCDQQGKGQLRKDQELLMGDVLNLQSSIGRGVRGKGVEDQVGTIWEGILLAKHIAIQGSTLALKVK